MGETALSTDRILNAAEDVIRKYGPDKATVVDVAKALGVTHGSVYRYFPNKVALREAVVTRWLEIKMPPLRGIVEEDSPAPERLRRYFDVLIATKRKGVASDPELFAAYFAMAVQLRDLIRDHVDQLVGQIASIIAQGVASGDFASENPARTALAMLHATTRFHNPAVAAEWSEPGIDAELEGVWELLMSGLRA